QRRLGFVLPQTALSEGDEEQDRTGSDEEPRDRIAQQDRRCTSTRQDGDGGSSFPARHRDGMVTRRRNQAGVVFAEPESTGGLQCIIDRGILYASPSCSSQPLRSGKPRRRSRAP